jgi:hypothetical protein
VRFSCRFKDTPSDECKPESDALLHYWSGLNMHDAAASMSTFRCGHFEVRVKHLAVSSCGNVIAASSTVGVALLGCFIQMIVRLL